MQRAGIIINPNAKKIRRGKTSLEHYKNFKCDQMDIRISQGLDEIKSIAVDFKKNGIDCIAIAGGDGTVHLTLTEIIKVYGEKFIPPVLILKEGTMDNVSRTIPLKGSGLSLLKKMKQRLESGEEFELHRRRTIKIQDRYAFLFGTGLITTFLNEVYSGKEKGLLRNLQVGFDAMKEALSNRSDGKFFVPENNRITIDGKPVNIGSVNGILAGTVEHVGMSFSPLIDATQRDNAFQVIITALPPRKMLFNLNKLRKGKPIPREDYGNLFAKELVIESDAVFDYTMDGDIYEADRLVKVDLGPNIDLIGL